MSHTHRHLSRRDFLFLAAHGLLAVGAGCRTVPDPEPTAVPTLVPVLPQATPTPDLAIRLSTLIEQAAQFQDRGVDISPVVPYLSTISQAIELERPDLAEPLLGDGLGALDRLPADSPTLPPGSVVQVKADTPGLGIPRLAGSVTIRQPLSDPRFQRFRQDIRPGLVQMRLPLNDLNPARDNYLFLQADAAWQETFQQINSGGGQVLLALQGIPSRLGLPSASGSSRAGAGPLAGPAALEEWGQIVSQVVGEFNRTSESRIALLQDLGEPNAGAYWVDPQDPGNPRPSNVDSYAQHFRTTLQAARSADPDLLVGAPALKFDVNDNLWWEGLLRGLQADGQQLGFASFHSFDANFGLWDHGVAQAQEKLGQFGFSGIPLLATGWNAGPANILPERLRRSHMPASHALVGFQKQLAQGVGHTYTSLTSGPETGTPSLNADGGQHLLEIQGDTVIPNPIYNAFLLFSRMHDKPRLPFESSDPHLYGLASFREDEILVLLTYYEPLARDLEALPAFPYDEPDWGKSRTVTLEVTGLPFSTYNLETYRVDQDHANFATLGAEGAELRRASIERGEGSNYSTSVDIPLYGVFLAVFSRQG